MEKDKRCGRCDEIFEEPKRYVETYGLDTPPFYEYLACPICGGTYAEAFKCDICNEWIRGEYIKTTKGQRICEDCYNVYEIGEEE